MNPTAPVRSVTPVYIPTECLPQHFDRTAHRTVKLRVRHGVLPLCSQSLCFHPTCTRTPKAVVYSLSRRDEDRPGWFEIHPHRYCTFHFNRIECR